MAKKIGAVVLGVLANCWGMAVDGRGNLLLAIKSPEGKLAYRGRKSAAAAGYLGQEAAENPSKFANVSPDTFASLAGVQIVARTLADGQAWEQSQKLAPYMGSNGPCRIDGVKRTIGRNSKPHTV